MVFGCLPEIFESGRAVFPIRCVKGPEEFPGGLASIDALALSWSPLVGYQGLELLSSEILRCNDCNTCLQFCVSCVFSIVL